MIKKLLIGILLATFCFTSIGICSDNSITDLVIEENLTTPSKIARWMLINIIQTPEEKDYWQLPSETLERKTGDCEDYAFFAQALLKEIGIGSTVVAMESWVYDFDHAICIFEYEDKLRVFDVYRIWTFSKSYKTVEDVIHKYFEATRHIQFKEHPANRLEDNTPLPKDIQKILDEATQDLLKEHIEMMQRGEFDEVYGGEITKDTKIPKYDKVK